MADSPTVATPGGAALQGVASSSIIMAAVSVITELIKQPHGDAYALGAGILGAGLVGVLHYFGAPKTAATVATAIDSSGIKQAAITSGLDIINTRLAALETNHSQSLTSIQDLVGGLQDVQNTISDLNAKNASAAKTAADASAAATAANVKVETATSKLNSVGSSVSGLAERLAATNQTVSQVQSAAADAVSTASEAQSAVSFVRKLTTELHGQIGDVQKAHNALANGLSDDAFKAYQKPATSIVPIK